MTDDLVEELAEHLAGCDGRRSLFTDDLDAIERAYRDEYRRTARAVLEMLSERGRLLPDRPEVGCCWAAFASEGHAHDPECLYLLGLRDGRAEGGVPGGATVEEQWTMRYLLNGKPQLAEDGGHIFDSRADAERHIEAWRQFYPALTYSDVEYLRRDAITTEWVPVAEPAPNTEETT